MYSFQILNQFSVQCLVLSFASWFLCFYGFLRRQMRWSGIPISSRSLEGLLWSTQSKALSVVNEAKVDVFLEFPCFFYDPRNVGSLISGSSAFFKFSLYICNFLVRILLKPSLKDFEHYLTGMFRNECNCVVVWTFFGIVCLWDWNENWPFPVLWRLPSFQSDLLTYWVQHFCSIIF